MTVRPPCPSCGAKIDYRTVERTPLENEWVPFCPSCGWGTSDGGSGTNGGAIGPDSA